jgi:hypothetical protein
MSPSPERPTGECRVAMSGPTCADPNCPPCQHPEMEQVEDRWPVIVVTASAHIEDAKALQRMALAETPYETYYPESAPNVLSPDEARLLCTARMDLTTEGLQDRHAIEDRIFGWAEGEEAK